MVSTESYLLADRRTHPTEHSLCSQLPAYFCQCSAPKVCLQGLSLGACSAEAVWGFTSAPFSAFFRSSLLSLSSDYSSINQSFSLSVFYVKSQENLLSYIQLDKSHVLGTACCYVSYCVIEKKLDDYFHVFRNTVAILTHTSMCVDLSQWYMSTHCRKCSFQQDTLWSKVMVVQVSIWTLSWLVSAGIDGLDALSWEMALLHSEKQVCPWSTVEGTGIKGRGYSLLLPWYISVNQSTSMCLPLCGSARRPAVPGEEREKSLIAVSIFFISHQLKFFLVLFFLVLNSPFKKASN